MKINLLREDQMTKVPHQKKEKEVLRFDDTFSGGNDDFYFQQPTPPTTEEYKKPRKFHFWLFLLIVIIIGLGVAFIFNPAGTIDVFKDFGRGVVKVWNKTTDKIQTSWLHRNDDKVNYVVETPPAPVQTVDEDETVQAPQQVIKIEKPIEKELVKETTEEKILESPPVFDEIRDELALSRRNMIASEFVWSKVPGGMIMDKFSIEKDGMIISVRSRFPLLIQSYAKVIEQHDMFPAITIGEEEKVGEMTRNQLSSTLPAIREEDRPKRIWDLDVEWFDDYLVIAANNSDVVVTQSINGKTSPEEGIVRYQITVQANGNRISMMEFLQELQAIPAAFVVEKITSSFDEEDQSNILELEMVYYERE